MNANENLTDREIVERIERLDDAACDYENHDDYLRDLHHLYSTVAHDIADHELARHVFTVLYCVHLQLTGCEIPDNIAYAWEAAAIAWDQLAERILGGN